jgi:hypothetical protein
LTQTLVSVGEVNPQTVKSLSEPSTAMNLFFDIAAKRQAGRVDQSSFIL